MKAPEEKDKQQGENDRSVFASGFHEDKECLCNWKVLKIFLDF